MQFHSEFITQPHNHFSFRLLIEISVWTSVSPYLSYIVIESFKYTTNFLTVLDLQKIRLNFGILVEASTISYIINILIQSNFNRCIIN